ncbi:cilia- and flagella-associated protein 276 [Xenentodon cancila]
MSSRNPHPSRNYENDFTLSGFRPQQRKTYKTPVHIAQREEPWSRLHDTATLASTQQSVLHHGHQAPSDSLDFHLESIYDHHKDLFWSKNQIFYQKETVSDQHRWMFGRNKDYICGVANAGLVHDPDRTGTVRDPACSRLWLDQNRLCTHRPCGVWGEPHGQRD